MSHTIWTQLPDAAPIPGTPQIASLYVTNVAALRALAAAPTENLLYSTLGHATAGDGRHLDYRWDSASTTADNDLDVIKITAVATGRFIALPLRQAQTKTASFTVAASDYLVTFLCDPASGTLTATLPPAASARNGSSLVFTKTGVSSNKVIVDADGAETISEVSLITLRAAGESVTVFCDGTKWHVASRRFNAHIGQLSDGAFVVSSNTADFDIGSGTSPGCVIIEHNRFFRTFNQAGNGTIRLIGINNANHVVISGEPVTSKVIVDTDELLLQRNTGGEQTFAINRDGGTATSGESILAWQMRRLNTLYVEMKALVSDATAASEDGRIALSVRRAGAMTSMLNVDPAANTNNPISIFVNGVESRVDVGVVDSGGAGYRLLRVPN